MEGQFPDDSHLLGELHQTIGDMAEKQAFDALREKRRSCCHHQWLGNVGVGS